MASIKDKLSSFISSKIDDFSRRNEIISPIQRLPRVNVSPNKSFGNRVATGPIGDALVDVQNFLNSSVDRVRDNTVGLFNDPTIRKNVRDFVEGRRNLPSEVTEGLAPSISRIDKPISVGPIEFSPLTRRRFGNLATFPLQSAALQLQGVRDINRGDGFFEKTIGGLELLRGLNRTTPSGMKWDFVEGTLFEKLGNIKRGEASKPIEFSGSATDTLLSDELGVTNPLAALALDLSTGLMLGHYEGKFEKNLKNAKRLKATQKEFEVLANKGDLKGMVSLLEDLKSKGFILDKEKSDSLKRLALIKNNIETPDKLRVAGKFATFDDFFQNAVKNELKNKSRFVEIASGHFRALNPDGTVATFRGDDIDVSKLNPNKLKQFGMATAFIPQFDENGDFVGVKFNPLSLAFIAGGTLKTDDIAELSKASKKFDIERLVAKDIPGIEGIKYGDELVGITAGLDEHSKPYIRWLKAQEDLDQRMLEKRFKKFETKKATISDVAKMVNKATREGIDVPVAIPYKGNLVKGIRDRLVSSIEGALRDQGKSGNAAADLIKKSREIHKSLAGPHVAAMKEAFNKLNEKELAVFSDVAEGKAQANTKNLKVAASVWDSIRKDIARRASETKLKIRLKDQQRLIDFVPRENYYPHFVPKEIIDNPVARKRALIRLVQSGWASSLAEAEAKFNKYVLRKVKRRYGNLENARIEDFPIYEKDARKVLLSYIDSAYGRIADASQYGPDDSRLYALADNIALEGGDGDLARRMFDRVLGKEDVSEFAKQASGVLTGIQTVTKLGLGAITNIGQSISTALFTNPKVTVQAIGEALGSNKASSRRHALEAGEILDSSLQSFVEQAGGESNAIRTYLKNVKFTASEEFNRTVAVTAGRRHLQQLFNKLKNNPTDEVSMRAIERLGLDPIELLKKGFLSNADLNKAGRLVSETTQFNTRKFDLPFWSTTQAGRVLFQFKSFAYKQAIFMKNQSEIVAKEARKGNFRPLTNALVVLGVAAPIAGEIINDVKALLRNKKREDKGLERYINNAFTTASLGLLEDVGTLITGKYGASGTVGAIGGPTASDTLKFLESIQSLTRDRKTKEGSDELVARIKPMLRLLTRNIPVIGSALSNALIPNNYVDSFIGVNRKEQKEKIAFILSHVDELPTNTKDLYTLYNDAAKTESEYHDKRLKLEFMPGLSEEDRLEKLEKLNNKTHEAAMFKARILNENPDLAIPFEREFVASGSVEDRVAYVVERAKNMPREDIAPFLISLIENKTNSGKRIITKSVARELGIEALYNSVMSTGRKNKVPNVKARKVSAKKVPISSKVSLKTSTKGLPKLKLSKRSGRGTTRKKIISNKQLEALRNPKI